MSEKLFNFEKNKKMIKYLIIGFIAASLFTSCSEEEKETAPKCEDIEAFELSELTKLPANYTGKVKECGVNGLVEGVSDWVDGKLNGPSKSWNKEGQLEGEANYINGEMTGLVRKWYENGQLFSEVNYGESNGRRDGLARYWHENGQLEIALNYTDDNSMSNEENGIFQFGKVADGSYETFDEKGIVLRIESFKGGTIIKTETFKNGEVVSCIGLCD